MESLQFGTPLLKGRLHSGDTVFVTSIEGTPPFRGHSMCQLYRRDTSIQGTQYVSRLLKGHLHSGDTVCVTSLEGTPPFRGHSMCHLYWRDTSIQGTNYVSPLFKGHLHLGDIVFVTSIEGTPLFTRKEQVFWVLKAGFNFHSGDALALKKLLTTKTVVKF